MYRTLLLAFSVISVIYGDPINLEILIRCDPSIKFYCGHIIFYEVDVLPGSHDSFKTDRYCTDQVWKELKYSPISLGGDASPVEWTSGLTDTHTHRQIFRHMNSATSYVTIAHRMA
ncbi:hypothetical protein GCK72_015810 [Caenorhabditis remanei]|uniref:Uncharacterized protein n=1 Tax=Caenorhabditis remanei TaxID=31234 RepID=A0A6A5GXT6_CAERE|nr:hypothetical protein GCK72_015810 [Caenorhabditis remanei]KAF1759345.1 hypothetical protein GCK72_015810 [Caenorhabditis remanei]